MGRNPQACLLVSRLSRILGWTACPCRLSLLEYNVFSKRKELEMSTMTMRIDDVDAAVVRKYAKFEGKTISDFIRDAVFEKIETQDDLAALRAAVEEDDGTRYTHAQVLAELGL